MKLAKQRYPRHCERRFEEFVVLIHPTPWAELGFPFSKNVQKPVVMKPQLVQTEGIRLVPDDSCSIEEMAKAVDEINFRELYRLQLAEWFANEVINPFVSKCKALGMSDDEAAAALNASLFKSMRGLHGF